MKAMILAAGLGTRLRPLTDHRPKALVEVQGYTLLQVALRRLASFGIREVIVNVHHFPDMVVEYLKKNDSFGMRIEISREDVLLDTGGGLKKAAWFFLENPAAEEESFLLHNVDVISTIDFRKMLSLHREGNALATLAVQERNSSRYLLFNERNKLCGRWTKGDEPRSEMVQPPAGTMALAFCGIHVISNRFLSMMTEDGAFSIIASYLRLAERGEDILAFRAEESYWRDLGKPENVRQAGLDAQRGMLQF